MPSRLRHPLGVPLLAALVLAAAVPAQKVYRDEKYGYAVKTVPKWVGVPVQPTERTVVAKWASPRDERRLPGRMLVHVFRRPPGDHPSGPEGQRPFPFPSFPSFRAFAKAHRRGLVLEHPSPLKLKGAAGRPATAQLFEATYGGRPDPRGGPPASYYTVIAVVTRPEREYAVELFCAAAVQRKYRKWFLAVARSFRLLDGAKPPGTPRSNGPAAAPRERARQRARQDARRVPGWWYVESENYFIVTNTPRKKKGRITDLRRRLEAMRKIYEKDFPPANPIEAVSIVRVCKDRQSYRSYGGPPGTGGYWNAMARELVLFLRGEKNFARSVLYHEAFHQYIYYACGEIRPHTWYNEGHADYYGGADVVGSRVVIRPNRMRIDTIRNHLRAGTYVPLPKFLHYTQAQYYRQAGLCYAEGWSLIYFLNKGVAPGHPWRAILRAYFRKLLETRKPGQALDAAFRGVDLEALDAAWKRFIVDRKIVRP